MYILRDRAAAEVAFGSAAAANACMAALDGVPLEGVGQLRVLLLQPGAAAASLLPDSSADPPPQQQQQFGGAGAAAAQWGAGGWAPSDPRAKPPSDSAAALQQQQQPPPPQQQQQSLSGSQQLQVGSSSSSSSNGMQRVCRLELVGLFGGEPTFSVAAALRGSNDSNIQYILEHAKHKLEIGIRGKPLTLNPKP